MDEITAAQGRQLAAAYLIDLIDLALAGDNLTEACELGDEPMGG